MSVLIYIPLFSRDVEFTLNCAALFSVIHHTLNMNTEERICSNVLRVFFVKKLRQAILIRFWLEKYQMSFLTISNADSSSLYPIPLRRLCLNTYLVVLVYLFFQWGWSKRFCLKRNSKIHRTTDICESALLMRLLSIALDGNFDFLILLQ